jgi:hypothetical protein
MSLSANLVGTGTRADKYLGFTYFASFDTPGTDNGRTQVRLNSGSFIVPERLRADVQLNYDVTEGRFLEHRYLVGWTGSCYGVALGLRRYSLFGGLDGEEQRTSATIAVTLKNVGTIGSN